MLWFGTSNSLAILSVAMHLKTSYVMVRPTANTLHYGREGDLKTSYVMVRQKEVSVS